MDEEQPVRLKCKRCGKPIVRSVIYPDGRWVHEDDTSKIKTGIGGTVLSVTDYDHEPDPDVIDVLQDSVERHPSSYQRGR